MKITDYCVVESSTAYELQFSVMRHIDSGWQPIGGIASKPAFAGRDIFPRKIPQSGSYNQAMVKYEEVKP